MLDQLSWNRTSALMAMTAQINAKKGKTFSPADFNPYLHGSKAGAPDVSTKEAILDLAEKFKKI